MARDVRHPRIPHRLRSIGGAEQVEREEMAAVGLGVGDENRASDDEGQADGDGGLPAGAELVGDDGVEDCTEDRGGVDGGRVVVLLYGCAAAPGHPQRHDVVREGLHAEGVEHEEEGQQPELPKQEHAAEDCQVPGHVFGFAEAGDGELFFCCG